MIDRVVEAITNGEHRYDGNGRLAAARIVDEALLEELLENA